MKKNQPQESKSSFIASLIKKSSKRKTPLTFKEIETKVIAAGYNSVYRSEVYRVQGNLANA